MSLGHNNFPAINLDKGFSASAINTAIIITNTRLAKCWLATKLPNTNKLAGKNF